MRYIMLTQNNLNDQNTVLYEIYGQPHINPSDLYQYQIPNDLLGFLTKVRISTNTIITSLTVIYYPV